jgi:hypothetical protein
MRAWLIVGLALVQAPALAQFGEPPDQDLSEPQRSRLRALQDQALQLISATRELGNWDEHYAYMLDAMERMYERNGWDAESDLFSLEMVREVGSIPPWAPQERIDKFMEMVGDRYLLDDDQMASLQGHLFRVNLDLFSRHADRIMEYAPEMIQARAAGEPFTPEQVARWVELAEPVMKDARQSVQEAAKVFMEELDPEQRELLQRDLAAADGRMLDIDRMAQKWKRGEWTPRDWGMEQDPIQMQGAPPSAVDATADEPLASDEPSAEDAPFAPADASASNPPPDEQVTPKTAPPADDEWARYVRAFIRKYDLNHEQQQRAWLLYHDAKGRDDVFDRRFRRQTETLRAQVDGSKDERAQAILRERTERHQLERERLFSQLKRRLDRLPTRAQRKNALPGEIDASPSATEQNAPPKKPSEAP